MTQNIGKRFKSLKQNRHQACLRYWALILLNNSGISGSFRLFTKKVRLFHNGKPMESSLYILRSGDTFRLRLAGGA
jgi:hypothetical protein